MLNSKIVCNKCKYEEVVSSQKYEHKDQIPCPKCNETIIYYKNIYFEQRNYTPLSSVSFSHPLDQKALNTLMAIPGLNQATKIMMKYSYEMLVRVNEYADDIKVTERTCSYINDMSIEAAKILGVKPPEVFINQNPAVNACTTCVEKPMIVINSGLIELFDDEELYVVIAHEMGHIKCEHVLYHMLANFISHFPDVMGVAKLLTSGINVALLEWYRKSELTADRASLIVTGNKNKVVSVLMKLAGGSSRLMNMIDFDDFVSQHTEYEKLMEGAGHKMAHWASTLYRSHPFPIIRAHEIDKWKGLGSEEVVTTLVDKRSCSKCNSILDGDEKFCPNCGNKLDN